MTTLSKRRMFILAGYLCLTAAMLFGQTPAENKGFLSFSVKVVEENSPLYSSPDETNSYMTGRVKAGEILEVFFRTENGWCAVRPPEGSFSWINGDYVLRDDTGVGTVVCPDASMEVPVRVGSDSILGSSDVQVGLESGRQVQILGEQTLTGNKTWLKIAPPRGEFRWIHQNALAQDEFFSRIPDKLTRYEEMVADGVVPHAPGEGIDFDSEILTRLDEEKIDPSSTQTTDSSDPIRKVSFDNSFNKELAVLYRDLFTAIESSESNEAFEYLSRRGAALESKAVDDSQRAEAQKLNSQILSIRQARTQVGAENRQAGFSEPVEARPIFQSPSGHPSAESEQVLFALPQSRVVPSQSALSQPGTQTSSEMPSNKVRFAFAPRGEKTGSVSSSEKKGLFSAKPSTIVPPANYTYPAPAQLKISSPSGSEPNQLSPEGTAPSETRPAPQNQVAPSKVFLAQDQSEQEIRQVSALFVKPEISGGSASLTSPPNSAVQSAAMAPQRTNTALTGILPPDITGVLGYLPNSTGGAPSYALISKNGNQNSIICYVVPQQGKSLDPYVGKKVAVNGSRGWFKKGDENRKMIVAETVRIY